MADIYWFDLDNGNDGNDGLSDTTPKKTFWGAGWATKAKVHGDRCIVRRGTSETCPAAHTYVTGAVQCFATGDTMFSTGCPRPAVAITGDFTQGSVTVNNVDISLTRGAHQGRRITLPNGDSAIIEWITDASTLILTDKYVGATDTTASASIDKDELWDWYDALGVGDGRTGAWDSDVHDLPKFIPNGNNLMGGNGYHHDFYNFDVDAGNNGFTTGMFYQIGWRCSIIGCLVRTTKSAVRCILLNKGGLERVNITGSKTGGDGGVAYAASDIILKDVQVNNCTTGLYTTGNVRLENVNLGQVQVNTSDALIGTSFLVEGENVKYDTSKLTGLSTIPSALSQISLGHKDGSTFRWFLGYIGGITSNDGSGADVNLRSGGSTFLHEIFFNQSAIYGNIYNPYTRSKQFTGSLVQEDIIEAGSTDAQTFRYYVQSTMVLTAQELWLEATYVKSYYSADTWSKDIVISTQAFTVRADADDWGEYLEVTLTPAAIGTKIILRILATWHDATNKCYVDPQLCDENGAALVQSNGFAWGMTRPNIRLFDEAARNISAGAGNIRDGIIETIQAVEIEGTYEPDFPERVNVAPDDTVDGQAGTMDICPITSVDPLDTLRTVTGTMDVPALASVLTTDTLRNVAGTFDEAARNIDPTEGKVLDTTVYRIHDVEKTGSLAVGAVSAPAIIARAYNSGILINVVTSSQNNTEYKVYYRTAAGPGSWTRWPDGSTTTLENAIHINTLLSDGVAYDVKVSANGASEVDSNIVSVTTDFDSYGAIETAFIDWIKHVTGYDADHVIFLEENAPKPSKPYIAIRATSFTQSGQAYGTGVDANGAERQVSDKQFTLNIECYGDGAPRPNSVLMDLHASVNDITAYQILKDANIAFVDLLLGPTDISPLRDNNTYEEAAAMDLSFRIPWSVIDSNRGFISSSVITGTVKIEDDTVATPTITVT